MPTTPETSPAPQGDTQPGKRKAAMPKDATVLVVEDNVSNFVWKTTSRTSY
jgi:hypothetical protein